MKTQICATVVHDKIKRLMLQWMFRGMIKEMKKLLNDIGMELENVEKTR